MRDDRLGIGFSDSAASRSSGRFPPNGVNTLGPRCGARRPRRLAAFLLAALAASALLACGDSSDHDESTALPIGLDAVIDLASLASLRPAAQRSAQVSSYDRTGGNIDAGLFGALPYSYLYEENGRYFIFDQLGPGVVYRIWMTGLDTTPEGGLAGDVAFELDGEIVPRLQISRRELFSGETPPFLAPLAGDLQTSSGGYFSLLPIPFAQRLRISTSKIIDWVQISHVALPPDTAIDSFDPTVDSETTAAALAAVGADPKDIEPATVDDVPLDLDTGASAEVWQRRGAGTILRFELFAPPGEEIPVGLRLRGLWDDAGEAQVDAPLDGLFGADLGAAARSLAFGRDGDRFYFYFPMPFRHSAQLFIDNASGERFTGWTLRVGTVGETLGGGDAALFHAVGHAALADTPGVDYVLLDTTGRGHVVGVTMSAGCQGDGLCEFVGLNGAHLEADEHVYIDGSRYPQIHGTGLEDFFNGGFYWLTGAFTLPTHGNPVQAETSPRRPGVFLRSAYRLFLGDAIAFHDSIRLSIEHGGMNDAPAELSSVVLYYRDARSELSAGDALSVADATSRAVHDYESDGAAYELTSSFRGDDLFTPLRAAGERLTSSRFLVTVDPRNRGVRLRRLADIGAGRQSATVRVDGEPAGTWYSADVNLNARWAELDFEIPVTLSAGKRDLAIEIDAAASPTPWTAFEYRAFSHLP